jgi:polyphosphate glucokinase
MQMKSGSTKGSAKTGARRNPAKSAVKSAAKSSIARTSARKTPANKTSVKKASATKTGARKTSAKASVAKSGILAIDIGGTGLKAAVIDDHGNMHGEHLRVPTPHPCPPQLLVDTFVKMLPSLHKFDRISIGFPGVIRNGHVMTAVNLGSKEWEGFPLAEVLSKQLGGHPARMVNDADMQGLALISGHGIEFVLTFGTGMGSALFRDGELMPHMELAHHPMHKGKTYEECLGNEAFHSIGKKRWNRRVARALELVNILLRPDRIFIGGGNAVHIELDLPETVIIGSNDAGLEGGAALWRDRPVKVHRGLPPPGTGTGA